MRSPLTATFFAVEITGDSHVLLPLLCACVAAHAVTVLLMHRSILTEKIARHGHHLTREYHVDPFELMQVKDVMTSAVETLPGIMTFREALRFFSQSDDRHPSFPVVNSAGDVLGIVEAPVLIGWRRAHKGLGSTLAQLLAGRPLPLAHPDEYLEDLINRMSGQHFAHVVVVSRADLRVVGYVGWRDLLRVRVLAREEESARETFFFRSKGKVRDSAGGPAAVRSTGPDQRAEQFPAAAASEPASSKADE